MRIVAFLIVTFLLAVPALAESCSGFDCAPLPAGSIACDGQNCAEAEGDKPNVCEGENCAAVPAGEPATCEGNQCPDAPGPEIIHVQ